MIQYRVSTLKLVRSLPFGKSTTISCIQRIDFDRQKSYQESTYYTSGNNNRKYDVPDRRLHIDSKWPIDIAKVRKDTLSILSEVKMKDLASAPPPAFWYGLAGLVPMLGIPIDFMISGYCSSLARVQLTFGATICAFLGGVRWGYTVPENSNLKPTWENLGWSLVPQVIGWFGLILPHSLGVLVVSTGLALAAFTDLTTGKYPPWFKSLRLFLTIPAILGLLITFVMRPFS